VKSFETTFSILEDPQQRALHHNAVTLESDAHAGLGAVHLKEGRLPEAESRFRMALETDPKHANGHYGLGGAKLKDGDASAALESFHAAIRINPQSASLHYDAGVAHLRQGSLSAAGGSFRAATAIDPLHVDAQHNLNVVFQRMQHNQNVVWQRDLGVVSQRMQSQGDSNLEPKPEKLEL